LIKLVIFDLDDTLVDTSLFKVHRDNRDWGKVEEYLDKFEVMNDAKEAISILNSKGIQIAVLTSSNKDYAEKILNHFNLHYDYLYGFAELKKLEHDYTSLKTGGVCELKNICMISSEELLFVGDSDKDYKACVETNCLFVTHPKSEAYFTYKGTILSVSSYNELVSIAQCDREVKVYENTHENFGDYISFSAYLKDTNRPIELGNDSKYSFDAMHKRILEVKNDKKKPLINWISLFESIDLKAFFQEVNYVSRVLGSDELSISDKVITTRDLIAFYFAEKLGAEYLIDAFIKSKPNEKLSQSGRNYEGRKELLHGSYKAKNIKEGNMLVFDDIITTGTSMEEVKRAFLEENTNSQIDFVSIGFTDNYSDEKYIQNIVNAKYFHCGTRNLDITYYQRILFLYLVKVLRKIEYFKETEEAKYGLFDVRGITILGENKHFIYFYQNLNNRKLIMKYFDNVDEMKEYDFHYYSKKYLKNIIDQID